MPRTNYEEHVKPYLKDITQWLQDGITEKSIYACLGLSHGTWYDWKKKYPDLMDATMRGRKIQTEKLDDAAFKAACGYTVLLRKDRVGRGGEVITCYEEVHYPPDHRMYALFRRNGIGDWKFRDETDTGDEQGNNALDKLASVIQSSKDKHGVE